MTRKVLGAFDAVINLAYSGAKKLFWAVVITAVCASILTVMLVTGIVAALSQ